MKALLPLAIWLAALAVNAQPAYVNYQGRLTGADGQPLTGLHILEFNIYPSALSGAAAWGPFLCDDGSAPGHTAKAFLTQDGRFNVILGATDTNNRSIAGAFGDGNRFLEIKIDGGPAIQPRQQFLSAPYALVAGALRAKGTNAIVMGDEATPASGAIQYQTNTEPPSLLIRGAGTDDSSRRITLSGAVSVTNATAAGPALAVAGDASLAGSLTAAGNATINGTLRAASLTDGARTGAISNILRSDPPMVISVISTNDSVNWQIVPVDLSVLGNDEDGCRIRVYMQHEVDRTLKPFTMDIWFEQPGFINSSSSPDSVRMFVQLFSAGDGAYYVGEYILGGAAQPLFDVISTGPWLQINNYPKRALNSGGVNGPADPNRYQLWFHFHPRISAKIMVFDN